MIPSGINEDIGIFKLLNGWSRTKYHTAFVNIGISGIGIAVPCIMDNLCCIGMKDRTALNIGTSKVVDGKILLKAFFCKCSDYFFHLYYTTINRNRKEEIISKIFASAVKKYPQNLLTFSKKCI